MSTRKDRVSLAVARDVAEELANVADSSGMTQYALANELLRLGLELIKSGYSPAQVRELAYFYRIMTELEIVPIPGRVLDKLISDVYRVDKETILKVWCDAGKMLAGYIKAVFRDLEAVKSFVPYLAKIVPAKKFDVKIQQDEVQIDIVGIGYSLESVEANAAAARCLLEEFEYKVQEVITAPGILHIIAKRQ